MPKFSVKFKIYNYTGYIKFLYVIVSNEFRISQIQTILDLIVVALSSRNITYYNAFLRFSILITVESFIFVGLKFRGFQISDKLVNIYFVDFQ